MTLLTAQDLHNAVKEGHIPTIEQCLESGIDVDVKCRYGETPLMSAARAGQLEAAQLLIDKKAKINATNSRGESVTAITTNSAYSSKVNLFLQLLENNRAPFEAASLHYYIRKGNLQKIKACLESGIDVDVKSRYGETPLMSAARSGQLEAAQLLINKGAKINATNSRGESVTAITTNSTYFSKVNLFLQLLENNRAPFEAASLHYYIRKGNLQKIKACLESGIDVNVRDTDGETPLMSATRAGQLEAAQLLINKGAKINATNSRGESVTAITTNSTYFSKVNLFLQLLENNRAPFEAASLHYYTKQNNIAKIKACLESGIDVDVRDDGETPLMRAAQSGQLEAAQLLINKRANVNVTNSTGKSVLEASLRFHYSDTPKEKTIKKLLAKGIDIISGSNNQITFSQLDPILQSNVLDYKGKLANQVKTFLGNSTIEQELINDILFFRPWANCFRKIYHCSLEGKIPLDKEKKTPEEKRYYAYFLTFIQYWKKISEALRAKALPNEIIDIIFEVGSFHDEFINIIHQFGISQLRAQEISSLFFSRINQPDAVWDAFMCDASTQESSLASTRFSMR